jgi:fructosamine-3-kinase
LAWTKPGELAGRALSRLAGLSDPEIRWSLTHGSLWFENQIASLELNGRQATLVFEKAVLGGSGEPGLEKIYEYHLV